MRPSDWVPRNFGLVLLLGTSLRAYGQQDVTGIPSGTSLRWPSLAAHGRAVYLVANTFPITGDALPRPLAVLIAIPGTRIPLPGGQHQFAYPRGVFDRDGAYHLFWVEFASPATSVRGWAAGDKPVALWHAAYKNGNWNAPEQIADGSPIYWNSWTMNPAVDSKNRIHVVVPTATAQGRLAVLALSGTSGQWTRYDFGTAAAYASVTAWGSDSLVAALVGPDPALHADNNSLLITRSGDGGKTWSSPDRVSQGGEMPVISTAFISQLAKRIELVWAQTDPNNTNVLHHAESRDGGRTWDEHAPPVVMPSGLLTRFDGVVADCGVVELVSELAGSHGLRLIETRWHGAGVTHETLFPGDSMSASPALVRSDTGFYLAYWRLDRHGGGERIERLSLCDSSAVAPP